MIRRTLGRLASGRFGLAEVTAVLVGFAVLASGAGVGIDRVLAVVRDGIRSHSASGEIHIVEIDRKSLEAISVWPWPRRYHADLVDRLHAAGVRSIAFDVDFSASSNAADDEAFAAALQRAGGGVILPTLRQPESAGSSRFVDNLPVEPLRDHSFLALVNVVSDPDGMVRRMPLGLETAGVPRPSLASMIAEKPAEAGLSFPIDYSIEPASIPHHSFIDVLRGSVGAEQLRGKRILIGATAIEMGDRYPVPGHGVIPGVVIQALAAETLLAGPVPVEASGLWPLLLALILIPGVSRGSGSARLLGFLAGTLIILAFPLAGEHFARISFPLAPALAALSVAAAIMLFLDIAARFRRRAFTDADTGLPNLAAFERAAEAGKGGVAVVARIERFAAIAAGLGPAATANLIHRVADRLAFGHGQPIHRIDEDRLAWIERSADEAELEERLETLIALMRTPIDCGRLVDVTLAVGLAEPAEGGAKQQVANASLAAVRAGRDARRWAWFCEDSSEETNWHLSLLGELDAAMAAGHLWNAYQPKLDLASGRIMSVEALVRWHHAERGPIGPDRFIPLVEEHGRARDLTLHVFDRAVADAMHWRACGLDIGVAVNVSATLLLDTEFVELLRDRLSSVALPAERITIEVTESAAMKEPERAIAALESWRALGLKISIDDYGTGQSSLGYLQKLPATELKIDMSFVRSLVADRRNAIMVRSTIALAHELGMKVVAEGVEDAECLQLLATMGCDTAQGWHIGKPISAEALETFIVGRLRDAA
ncbi:bifunctional diguanylate cyclase/phosphodiesterase [Sphingosinicella sp. CPCC 101087]|uniref:putative bifunctional diguanylate cyclase/phosphodiesterase n=1 Tax=Sphingosinicella sp. CPCC 101087 TaxID=2497754 RepID=UPI00101BE763|nr:EAL domain-containing protein [Sphingosinicella sp. CPCC 101087]